MATPDDRQTHKHTRRRSCETLQKLVTDGREDGGRTRRRWWWCWQCWWWWWVTGSGWGRVNGGLWVNSIDWFQWLLTGILSGDVVLGLHKQSIKEQRKPKDAHKSKGRREQERPNVRSVRRAERRQAPDTRTHTAFFADFAYCASAVVCGATVDCRLPVDEWSATGKNDKNCADTCGRNFPFGAALTFDWRQNKCEEREIWTKGKFWNENSIDWLVFIAKLNYFLFKINKTYSREII